MASSEAPPAGAANQLPNPNRFITTHDDNGVACFATAFAEPVPASKTIGDGVFRLAYATDRPPVTLSGDADIATYAKTLKDLPQLLSEGGGPLVWYVDTPPGGESPLHRTVSLDFVVQVHGEMELTLESGESRTVRPGDLTIQRGTMHKWRNPSTTAWSRMLAVMAQCEPVEVKGEKLEMYFAN